MPGQGAEGLPELAKPVTSPTYYGPTRAMGAYSGPGGPCPRSLPCVGPVGTLDERIPDLTAVGDRSIISKRSLT